MKTLLKNLTLIDPSQNLKKLADLMIEDGVIAKIGDVTPDGDVEQTLDLAGHYCAPGFFDMHVHLREPGREDVETIKTGCNAAAAGGFTSIAPMPDTDPAADCSEVISAMKERAEDHLVSLYPVGAGTIKREGELLAPIAELFDAGVVAISDMNNTIKSGQVLRRIMEYAMMFDLPVIEHCEEPSLSNGIMNEGYYSTVFGLKPKPSIAEDITVMRDIIISEYTNAKLHITHVSTKAAVEMIRQAKARGVRVTADTAPQYFTFTEKDLKNYDTNLKLTPPLRSEEDRLAVIAGLADGTIDAIASSHEPRAIEEKEHEFIYAFEGMIGLETTLGVSFTELFQNQHLTIEQLVEKFAINPRKILNLNIPAIKEGDPAELTVFNPDEAWTVDASKFKSKARNCAYNGYELKGKSIAVINNGYLFDGEGFKEI